MNPSAHSRIVALFDRHAGTLAVLCCAGTIFAFAAAFEPFSHRQHPVALLGARGVPGAVAFNLLCFVVPGLLAAGVAVRLRARLPAGAGRTAAIGVWMLAISALAFAAQGLWPLDPADLENARSQRHATAWLLWWLSFAPGAVLLGLGVRSVQGWRSWAGLFITAGLLAIVLNALPATWLPGPIAQRVLLALWLACVWGASRRR
ncbi:DUF998 domain-containing protein [Lysobacter sp. S4-A87]|uniref:DUF998 domain-containing protein n=1 Tax=Lysobacter sp. S4-A87 TaxID=2925843 RepID=UPI001F538FC5|nr:DUF998 domain-containing protein [Lysobacter sp. S4-A87]UNK49366.1 DUF998 domain-containing protein [Lysobacter sp. S4-A87]